MSNPAIAGVAGAAACALMIGAGSLVFSKMNDTVSSALSKLSTDAAEIAEKLGEKLGNPPKVEVNVPDIRLPRAEEAMNESFGALTGLTLEVQELSEAMRGWSSFAWSSGVVLFISGATYGLVIWPRQVVRDYLRRTLAEEDMFLEDDPPRVAMALLDAQVRFFSFSF